MFEKWDKGFYLNNIPRIWINRSTNASLAAMPAPASGLIERLATTLMA